MSRFIHRSKRRRVGKMINGIKNRNAQNLETDAQHQREAEREVHERRRSLLNFCYGQADKITNSPEDNLIHNLLQYTDLLSEVGATGPFPRDSDIARISHRLRTTPVREQCPDPSYPKSATKFRTKSCVPTGEEHTGRCSSSEKGKSAVLASSSSSCRATIPAKQTITERQSYYDPALETSAHYIEETLCLSRRRREAKALNWYYLRTDKRE